MIIGRAATADVRLENERVSRQHAELIYDPFGRWLVRDLGSRMGIQVNGRKVSEQLVGGRDVILVEPFVLQLVSRPAAGDPAPVLEEDAETHFDARALEEGKVPPITATHLEQLMALGEALQRTPDARQRQQMLCDAMTENWYRAAAALVVRQSAGGAGYETLCQRVIAGKTYHISRSLLNASWRTHAPMVGCNSAARAQDVFKLSIARSTFPAAGVACPLSDAEGDLTLYVGLDPEFATQEWLSLASLAARQWRQAESVWHQRQQASEHEAVEGDLRKAKAIQEGYLPRKCVVDGFEWAMRFEPCRWVGGDYLELAKVSDRRVFAGVADVSGKGLQAGLLAANLHTLVRTALRTGTKLVEIFDHANAYLLEFLPTNSFITMTAFLIDLENERLEYVNAGHPPPFMIDPAGSVKRLEASVNLPLGVGEEKYVAQAMRLKPGHTFVLYSDGCTDLLGPQGDRLSVKLLGQMVKKAADSGTGPKVIVESVYEMMEKHRGACLPPDDRALLAFAVK
jgi:serine phosphatase RsbU (regulator of sigma subunit)